MNKSVLIIEDDLNTCREIQRILQNESTDVHYVLSAKDALEWFYKQPLCLVIMDIHPSDIDGIQLLQTMREAKPVPIIVLVDKESSAETVRLLKLGANACLQKPVDMELCAVQAQSFMDLYTNSTQSGSRCYTLSFDGELIIDPTCWQVILFGKTLKLTYKEFCLLYCLASHKGQVLSKEQLYDLVWGYNHAINVETTIKSHIRTLRQKLGSYGQIHIESVRGVGYRFNAGAEAD